jgi:hypothetical protein
MVTERIYPDLDSCEVMWQKVMISTRLYLSVYSRAHVFNIASGLVYFADKSGRFVLHIRPQRRLAYNAKQ